MSDFTDTTSELARKAGTTAPTIRRYAEAGLLRYVIASDGTRLFQQGQADAVREILAARMANRGRRSSGE